MQFVRLQDRILDFLLEVEDAAERAALLPDAFTPPGDGGAGVGFRAFTTIDVLAVLKLHMHKASAVLAHHHHHHRFACRVYI